MSTGNISRLLTGFALSIAVGMAVIFPVLEWSGAAIAEDDPGPLQDYLDRQLQQDTVIAQAEGRVGKPFAAWTTEDYAEFLTGLDLQSEGGLWEWSHVTGVPIVALRKGYDFFRSNAHLLADTAAAQRMSAETLEDLTSEYNRKESGLVVRDADETALPLRDIPLESIRVLEFTAQIRRNEQFADDRTSFPALGPYLARLEELRYLGEVEDAIKMLPLPVVRVLRGKALYLSTERGRGSVTISHDVSSNRSPDHVGMQIGVFLEWRADGTDAEELVRGIARIVRETVLEGQYFGIYLHPLQYSEFQKLDAERRRLFGRRRDALPQTAHGYVNVAARKDPTTNFVEHFVAYLTEPEAFRVRASREQAQGYPELMEKYRFMERLIERTPATAERASLEHVAHVDMVLQGQILEEYLTRQKQKHAVVRSVEADFGKPFQEFTVADYASFMAGLDLGSDDDLWAWSHATGIPVVGLSQRSNFFHMNAHLLADASAANALSWSELRSLRGSYDGKTDRLTVRDGEGNPLQVRDLPPGTVRRTESTRSVQHNEGFTEDRIVFEALGPHLVRLADLENREELAEGIRLLPLSIVKSLRGKAIYPTNRSRTGWAVNWRVGTDQKLSYIGMQPGGFVELRRDQRRAPESADSLVDRGLSSLKGNSADSLVHEVGHLVDGVVIGRGEEIRSFPFQFPEFQRLRSERDRVFREGNSEKSESGYGYISPYSKSNSQEDFAEHFWAYLRDREGFLARAKAQEAEGHPGLVEKFLFIEKLVDHTPATERRLSPQLLAEQESQAWEERAQRAAAALEEYRLQQARKESVVAAVEKQLGKSFPELTGDEYARFMDGLDLSTDDDLWKWSHVTGIPIVALSEKSTFFYTNAHLIKDVRAAIQISHAELVGLRRGYDATTGEPTLLADDGQPLELREFPVDTLRRAVRTGRYSHDEGFAEPRIVLETLAPYLVPLGSIPNRQAIVKGLRALPLSVVKAYRGKAIYLTTRTGRSYSVGMPISNSTYRGFAGMQSGFFLDRNNSYITTHNLVHEIGHVLDYTVIKGQYGTYLHAYQFPELRELSTEKDLHFGYRDDPVPQTDFGYVSSYAKTNAQENFADHFAYFILQREKFLEMAEEQQAGGHPELMAKYRFLETLLERTPVTTVRLSSGFVEGL